MHRASSYHTSGVRKFKFKWIFDLRTQLEEKLRIERENTNQFVSFSTRF